MSKVRDTFLRHVDDGEFDLGQLATAFVVWMGEDELKRFCQANDFMFALEEANDEDSADDQDEEENR